MTAHILDLYDIHARGQAAATVYRNVLQQGVHPAPGCLLLYLPSRLCVTLHYLSEICRKACGIPVTYWIDRFTLHEIANLLCQKETASVGDSRRDELLVIFLFQPVCIQTFRHFPHNVYRESLNRVR